MGIERLAYRTAGDSIVFSTSVSAIADCPGMSASLRPQALFEFLLLHMVPAPGTVFANIQKLRAGTCVQFKDGKVRAEPYWVPNFAVNTRKSESRLAQELHESLTQAVARSRPGPQTGAFLSGGLDSSTVAGVLGKVTGAPARTFSIGFGVDEYNELAFADIANRHFHAIGTQYHVTPDDVVSSFHSIAAAFDEPFGNSSAIPTYFCARLAADNGMHGLLAGDGGDELFAGNERYARQRVFDFYRKVPLLLRRGLIEPFAGLLSPESRLLPLRKLRSYVDQAKIPMPERLESWNFMYRTDLDAMLEPEFRAAIDPRLPIRAMAEVFNATPDDSLLNRMLYFDWQYTLSDNDLRKVGVMCELAGVDVSYPMLDHAVIDLSLRVPAAMKMKRMRLRSFYKNAMAGFLPAEIIAKGKHGFGLPFGPWLRTHRRLGELVYGLLSDLKKRTLVRGAFLDDLVEQQRVGHANYFGYAIWDLAILEAWLQAHKATA
jgi:asparagine synthase (glutamine-hydrolysing)